MTIKELHNIYLKANSVCTDTRKINDNDLFFALKGDNFDGNKFAKQALEAGAGYVVVDDPNVVKSDRYILVEDVLRSLQLLATFHRRYLGIKILSLTGSNGKTTTKELINCVLSSGFKTSATIGNLNNHIGVPLTLLSMDNSTEIGIVEMGANHQKEIEFLCSIAEPDFGYITNFGKAHLEGFGGVEGVIKGKTELYSYLKSSNGLIFVNTEDPIQVDKVGAYTPTFKFGQSDNKDTQIEFMSADPFVKVSYQGLTIQSQLIGAYNFGNISAAIAIGHYFSIHKEHIKNAIESYNPSNNRSQIITNENLTIILDAYNANPSSMKAALDNFSKLSSTKKTAILGDMFELGNDAETEHQAIADYATSLGIDSVILVGENFYRVSNESAKKYETFDALKTALDINSNDSQTLLIKGSRGMALERILDTL